MSLVGKLNVALNAPKELAEWLQDQPGWDFNIKILGELVRLVQYFRIPIEASALQVYRSALCGCPQGSLIYHQYYDKVETQMGLPRFVRGMDLDWSPCFMVLQGHTGAVRCVAYQPDTPDSPGKIMATASYDNSIRLWDVQSGMERAKKMRLSNLAHHM